MDDSFDLDLALTVEAHNSSNSSSGDADTAITESSASLPPPMPPSIEVYSMSTVVGELGICTVSVEGFHSSCSIGKQAHCGHVYHSGCITKWLSLHNSCPLCRCIFSVDGPGAPGVPPGCA